MLGNVLQRELGRVWQDVGTVASSVIFIERPYGEPWVGGKNEAETGHKIEMHDGNFRNSYS